MRLLHAVNMAHNYKSYGGIFDRNTHSQGREGEIMQMNMKKRTMFETSYLILVYCFHCVYFIELAHAFPPNGIAQSSVMIIYSLG